MQNQIFILWAGIKKTILTFSNVVISQITNDEDLEAQILKSARS
jgi:hypothetical protein